MLQISCYVWIEKKNELHIGNEIRLYITDQLLVMMNMTWYTCVPVYTFQPPALSYSFA